MKIHFGRTSQYIPSFAVREYTMENHASSLNSINSQLALNITANVLRQYTTLRDPVARVMVPCIYGHHVAWQHTSIERENQLVIDPVNRIHGRCYYRWYGNPSNFHTNYNGSHPQFYRSCTDADRGYLREDLPSLDTILQVDYKLFFESLENKEQRQLLDDWLLGISPLKLLHVSIDEYMCEDSVDLLRRCLSNLRWETNLSLQIFDRSVHRQTQTHAAAIRDVFADILDRLITAELNSEPVSNLTGQCYLYNLKELDRYRPISYRVPNWRYHHYMDCLRNGRLR